MVAMGSIDEALARFYRLGGDALVRQMVTTFVGNASDRVAAAQRAVADGDPEQLAFAAHSLKSSAGNLGATRLMTLATQIEERAQAGGASGLAALVDELAAEFSSIRQRLEEIDAGPGNPGVKRIAVVEDNPDNRLLVHAILEDRYEILEYETGVEALPEIVKERPDLVLLDISLPGMDGREVLRRLKGNPDTARLPVIALTAHAMRGDRERFLADGFDDYQTKPIVDESSLLGSIERLLAVGD